MDNLEEIEQEEKLSPQPSPKRKYILIAAIVAVIVSAGILLLLMQKEAPLQAPEVKEPDVIIEDEIANWQTYRSEEYGFEVKYPKDWFFRAESGEVVFGDNDITIILIAAPRYEYTLQEIIATQYSLAEDSLFTPYLGKQIIETLEEITVDEEQALFRTIKWGPPEPPDFQQRLNEKGRPAIWPLQETVEQQTLLVHDVYYYRISGNADGENIKEEEQLYDQILSTFRFVEKEPIGSMNRDWDVPLNLTECKKGEQRTLLHGLGSKSVIVMGLEGNGCVLEYTNELEGGYTTYECVFGDSPPEIAMSTVDFSYGCTEIRSGSLLLENP